MVGEDTDVGASVKRTGMQPLQLAFCVVATVASTIFPALDDMNNSVCATVFGRVSTDKHGSRDEERCSA